MGREHSLPLLLRECGEVRCTQQLYADLVLLDPHYLPFQVARSVDLNLTHESSIFLMQVWSRKGRVGWSWSYICRHFAGYTHYARGILLLVFSEG